MLVRLYPVTPLDNGLVTGVNDATVSDHVIAKFCITGGYTKNVASPTRQKAEIIASDI
jgi:hypothetical protein